MSEANPQTLTQAMRRLKAVREYNGNPIPDADLQDILEVARWTGSSMNTQPWHLVVVKDRNTLQQIAQAEGYIKFVGQAQVAIVPVIDQKGSGFDEGRLVERILLAAHAHGIGAGMGWFQGNGAASVQTLLNIPAQYRVRAVIALGYPSDTAQKPRAKPGEARKPLNEIISYERF